MKLLEIRNFGDKIFEIFEVSQGEIPWYYITKRDYFDNKTDLDGHIMDMLPLRTFGYLCFNRRYLIK